MHPYRFHRLLTFVLLSWAFSTPASIIQWLTEPTQELPLIINNDANTDFNNRARISNNGRYITFISGASNLVTDDHNGADDLFMYDVVTGTTVRVNTTATGAELTGSSIQYFSAPTSDGRFVAFASNNIALTLTDTAGIQWAFLKDLQNGVVTNLSGYGSGEHFALFSDPHLSDDATRLTFATGSQIDPLHTGSGAQVYSKNLTNGNINLISKNESQTAAGNEYSVVMDVSGNNRYVLLVSEATDLTTDPINNNLQNLFLYDVLTQSMLLVNRTPGGQSSSGSTFFESAGVSNQGTVAFTSAQTDLVVNDSNDERDVFLYQNGLIERINLDPQGQQLQDSFTYYTDIDDAGERIVFTELADDVLPGDGLGHIDVFLYDVNTATSQLISHNTQGQFANNISNRPIIAGQGNHVVFNSTASDLTNLAINPSHTQIYWHSLDTDTTAVLTQAAFNPNTAVSRLINPRISQDQTAVIYSTESAGFDPAGGDDDRFDLYWFDRTSEQHELLFLKAVGEDISPSGRYVVFTSEFSQPGGIIELGQDMVYLYDRNLQQTLLIDEGVDAKVNDDGHVVFLTRKAIDANDLNNDYDVYGYDHNSQSIQLFSFDVNGLAGGGTGIDLGGTGSDTVVIFTSFSEMLPSDTPHQDVYARSWSDLSIEKISVHSNGDPADDSSLFPRISDNGRFVVFGSQARNLTNDDYTGAYYSQVFWHDRVNQTTALASVNDLGLPVENGDTVNIAGISSSGRYVAYTYFDSEDAPGFAFDDDRRNDVVLFDTQTETARIISNSDAFPLLPERSSVKSIVQVVEDQAMPPRIGVVFTATGAVDLTGEPSHPGHEEVFFYQQGGPDLTLQITVLGPGTVTGTAGISCQQSCTHDFPLGSEVSLISQAAPDAQFIGWDSSFIDCEGDATCQFDMYRAHQVTAIFMADNDLIFASDFDTSP